MSPEWRKPVHHPRRDPPGTPASTVWPATSASAIGSRIEAMRLHRAALAENEPGLLGGAGPDSANATPNDLVRPLVPKRLTDGLRRNLP